MWELNKSGKFVIVFVGAGLLWFIGFVAGSYVLDALEIFTKTQDAIVAWGIIWTTCLIAASSLTAYQIYEYDD